MSVLTDEQLVTLAELMGIGSSAELRAYAHAVAEAAVNADRAQGAKSVAFVDGNGNLIAKRELAPWTDLYIRPQSVSEANNPAAAVSPSSSVPDGWKVVPVEPTEEIAQAFIDQFRVGFADARMARECWEVMISAAPEVKP